MSRNEGAGWAELVVEAPDGQHEFRGISGIPLWPQIIHQVASFLPPVEGEGGDLWKFSDCRGSAVEGGHCKASPSEDFEFLKIELT